MKVEVLGRYIIAESDGRKVLFGRGKVTNVDIQFVDDNNYIDVYLFIKPTLQLNDFINDFLNNNLFEDVIRILQILSNYRDLPESEMGSYIRSTITKLLKIYRNKSLASKMLERLGKDSFKIKLIIKHYYLSSHALDKTKCREIGLGARGLANIYGKYDVSNPNRIIEVRGTKLIFACKYDHESHTYNVVGLLRRNPKVCIDYIEGREVKFNKLKNMNISKDELDKLEWTIDSLKYDGCNVIIEKEVFEILKTIKAIDMI